MARESEPKIAAALITKDSLGVIERCLDSIGGRVDEICVYDTGSSDGTVEYLESLSAVRVERGEWRDDFSWARERSFELVSPHVDWVLWLDDDDVLVGGEHLRTLARSADQPVDGFMLLYDYARNERGATVMQLWRERLVRRDRGFRWTGRVHESLRRADGREGNLVHAVPGRIRVVHLRPPEREKGDRNLELLVSGRAQAPADARTLAYLAAEYMARREYERAEPLLEEYLRLPPGWPDERAQVYHRLASCRLQAGDAEAAIETELQSLAERDDWPETSAGLTEAYAALGRWELVERWARRTLELGLPASDLPINPLELTFVPMIHLAEACFRSGRLEEGQAWLERAWADRLAG